MAASTVPQTALTQKISLLSLLRAPEKVPPLQMLIKEGALVLVKVEHLALGTFLGVEESPPLLLPPLLPPALLLIAPSCCALVKAINALQLIFELTLELAGTGMFLLQSQKVCGTPEPPQTPQMSFASPLQLHLPSSTPFLEEGVCLVCIKSFEKN